MAGDQMTWVDVTSLVSAAAKELHNSEMIHTERFSLFESMAALEIMDPKMDAGMSLGPREPESLEEAITAGKAPLPLTPNQLIDCMDQLTAAEATWHCGNALGQTVFTCVYMLDLQRTAADTPSSLLHNYCRVLLSTINLVRSCVCHSDMREEEDFVTFSFGLPLEDHSNDDCVAELQAAERVLSNATFAASIAEQHDDHPSITESTAVLGFALDRKDVAEALRARVAFRLALHDAFQVLSRASSPSDLDLCSELIKAAQQALMDLCDCPLPASCSIEGAYTTEMAHETEAAHNGEAAHNAAAASIADAAHSVSQGATTDTTVSSATEAVAFSGLTTVNQTSGYGKGSNSQQEPSGVVAVAAAVATTAGGGGVEAGVDQGIAATAGSTDHKASASAELQSSATEAAANTHTASGREAPGFCKGINKRLLMPTPPRTSHLMGWREACDYLHDLLASLQLLCLLPRSSPPNPSSIYNFLTSLRLKPRGAVVRAFQQAIILKGSRILGHDPQQIILASLKLPASLITPPQAPNATGLPPYSSLSPLTRFCSRSSHCFQFLLRSLCANPPRERRQLARQLSEWNDLFSLAQQVDIDPEVQDYCTKNFQEGWWRASIASSWAVEFTCRIIQRYLLTGFRDDLYAPSEYLSVYWYLDNVFGTLIHNMSAREAATLPLPAQAFTPVQSRKQKRQGRGSAAGKGRTSPHTKDSPEEGGMGEGGAEAGATAVVESVELQLHRIHQLLCKAYVRLLVALQADQKLVHRPLPFNTEFERYEQRFEVLKRVQLPEPLPFSLFQQSTSPAGLTVPELYQMTHDFFSSAGSLAQQLHTSMTTGKHSLGGTEVGVSASLHEQTVMNEVLQIHKLSMKNGLALQVSHKAGPGRTLKASFDLSMHPYFPAIILRRT